MSIRKRVKTAVFETVIGCPQCRYDAMRDLRDDQAVIEVTRRMWDRHLNGTLLSYEENVLWHELYKVSVISYVSKTMLDRPVDKVWTSEHKQLCFKNYVQASQLDNEWKQADKREEV